MPGYVLLFIYYKNVNSKQLRFNDNHFDCFLRLTMTFREASFKGK